MKKIRLIHWNAKEAKPRVAALEGAGYDVIFESLEDQSALARIGEGGAQAVVIDLTRVPSRGRDIGLWIRKQKSIRNLPLVFLGGATEKVDKIETLLPDAVYSDWPKFRSALKRALAKSPTNPVVPDSVFAGYSGTPLPKKLGIKPGFVVALVGAPPEFGQTLGRLPEDVSLRSSGRGKRNLTICFVRSCKQLDLRIDSLLKVSEQGHVWIAWPKKASGLSTDLTQTYVRNTGLAAGLVDFKICAIDETWSGLCFALRRK